ncbi:MAG: Ig-like domain repeat protein [Lachnospiraceae bacterium]|nr:Ig-like domain repeat protein [Lachnospiraceae bacterium]
MKIWKKIAAGILCLILALSDSTEILAAYNEQPQAKNLTVENSIIKFDVARKNGRFTISTEDGLPTKKTDNFHLLTFFKDIPDTSFTTIRIDGKDYIFGNDYGARGGVVQETIVIGKIATTVWRVNGVEVTQKLQLVTDMANPNAGNVKVSYEMANGSGADIEIGSRILLDTQLGNNDASAMMANSEYITNETILEGDKLPQVWQSSDRKFASNIVSYGYLSGWENIEPDRMVIAHWNTLADTKWDCKTNELLNFTTEKNSYGSADSAVALYYDPILLQTGETRTVETYYGIGSISDAVYTGGDFTVQIQAPQKTSSGTSFEVRADITNNTEEAMHDLVIEIGFSDELKMVGNKSTVVSVGTIDAGDIYRVTFELESEELSSTAVSEIGITVSQGENSSQSMKYVILSGKKGEVPRVQLTEAAPGILYTEDTVKKVTLKGSGFQVLKADLQWSMICRNERTGEEAEISRADIAIADDSTMTVKLPSDEVLNYRADDYTIQIQTQNYGNLSIGIAFTNDKSFIRKEYGVLLVGGFEENSEEEVVYGVKLLESEEEVADMTEEERDHILLTIRGEVDTYELNGKTYYTIGNGALLNNAIKYSNVLDKESVITLTRYEEQASDSVKESLKNQFSGWEWWGHVSDSLVMTGNGTLSVGDYSFHTGDFYICLEDGTEYELRGAESDESSDIEQEDETEEIVIKTPEGVVGNHLSNLIGVLTGFRVEVSDAVIGVETVSLGGSFSVELPWWSGGDDKDDDNKENSDSSANKLKDKFDKNEEVSEAIEGGVNNDSFINLNMKEMRYGLNAEENTAELVGVAASGGINLTDDSIPKFTKGGAGANFEIDSIEYPGWFIGIDANLKVGDAFECEFGFSLVRENTGKCYPDSINFTVGGDVVKIPLGTIGYLTKMGGGISGLYNTIKQNFNHFPPVTIKFVTGYADPTIYSFQMDTITLQAGGTGIAISGEEGKVIGLKLLEEIEAHLLLYGKKDKNGVITDCIDMGVGAKINIAGIVRGEAKIWLIYDPDMEGIFGYLSIGGKAYCGIFIPDWIPVLGGIELLAAMVELSTYRAYAGVRIIGIPISVAYYWADGEVKFFDDWEYISENFEIPVEDIENSLAVIYDSGDTNVDGVMLLGDNLTRLESAAFTRRTNFEYEFDILENDYTLIQAAYNPSDLAEGESVLNQVSLYDPDGNEIMLTENDNCLIQHIPAEHSESGADEYNLGIGLTAPKNGTWKIVSDMELQLTPYKVDEIASVEVQDAMLDEAELTVSYEVHGVKEGNMLDVYLVEKESDEESDEPGMKITESSILLEELEDGTASGTIVLEIPENIQSGTYEVRLVISEEEGAISSDVSDGTIQYTNPNTPQNVQNVILAPGGDGQYKISWDEVLDADGYFVQLLDEEGQLLEGFEGVTTTDTSIYMGGVYEVPEYGEDEDGDIILLDTREVGTYPQNSYRALVYAYKEKDKTRYPSTAVMTEPVYLPEPNPADITFTVDETVPLSGTMSSKTALYVQDDSYNILVNKKDVTMGLSSDQNVELAYSLDGDYGDCTIYTIEAGRTIEIPLNLSEGSHVIEITAKNEQGDYTQKSLCIEVDTVEPVMMLDQTVLCSGAGNYMITGTVEPNAGVYIEEANVLCTNGKFTYQGTGNDTLETIMVTAVDAAGNEKHMRCEVIPKEFSRIVDMCIMADGEELDSEEGVLELYTGGRKQLEVYGVMENGGKILLQKEKLTYSVLYNRSVADVSEDGNVSAYYAGDAVIAVEYPLTDEYTLEQTVSVKVNKYVIQPATIQLSSQEINVNAKQGEVAAHMIIPDGPENMEVTYTISENLFLEVSGSDLICKAEAGRMRSIPEIVITASGSFLDNDNTRQMFAFSQAFAFRLVNQVKEVEASQGICVKVGTAFEELELPTTVHLLLEDGGTVETTVSWKKGAYYPSLTRRYLLSGDVVLPEGITNPNDCRASILVDVEKYTANHSARNVEVVYDEKDIDVSRLFVADEKAGEVTYELIEGTGKGILTGSLLHVTKAGDFRIRMNTAENSMCYEQSVEAVLTVQKGQKDIPEGITVIPARTTQSKDGALYGVSPEMEYSSDEGKTYQKIAGNAVNGLGIGMYLVRYQADDLHVAGKPGSYTITNTGKETQKDMKIKLPSNVTYGCQPLDARAEGGSGTGEIKWKTSDSDIIRVDGDQLVVVGAGTVVITAVKQEDEDYNSKADSHKITVVPRTVELEWHGVEEREFDGNASSVKAVVTNLAGQDQCDVIIDQGTQVHAGTWKAAAVALTNSNYKLPEDTEVSYTILPKKVELMWSEQVLVYNGKDRTDEIHAEYRNIHGHKLDAVLKIQGKAFKKAGEYIVQAVIEDPDYRTAGDDQKKYYIDKAEVLVALSAEGDIQFLDENRKKSEFSFGSSMALRAAVAGVNDEILDGKIEFFMDGESLGTVDTEHNQARLKPGTLDQGTYEITAVFTPEEDSNYYAGGSDVLIVKVNQKGDIFVENSQTLPGEEEAADSGTQEAAAVLLLSGGVLFAIWFIRRRRFLI